MIKNWKLTLLALVFIGIFCGLGTWQLHRATEKKLLLAAFQERSQQAPLSATQLNQTHDWRLYRATLVGTFDNQHSVLLDNKTFHGQVGYEVYTPFYAEELNTPILIDRGFIPQGASRAQLPGINLIVGKIKVTGLLNTPPIYYSMGKMTETETTTWPVRVQYLQLTELSRLLPYPLYHYVLTLAPEHPASYQIEWKIVPMDPARHTGYAVQWFALALTLLIISVALNWRRPR